MSKKMPFPLDNEPDWSDLDENRSACKTCKYFVLLKKQAAERNYDIGSCHRHPPKASYFGAGWPQVTPEDWCGEYKKI